MIELFEQDIRENDRQSSKGNQLKWENQGKWYKAGLSATRGCLYSDETGTIEDNL